MKLYGSSLSQASLRVQFALALKGLDYELIELDLAGSEHLGVAYSALNPMNTIPTLLDGPDVLTQTLAIYEYLEARHPTPALMPADLMARTEARALLSFIISDITSLGSLRVVRHLAAEWGADAAKQRAWRAHWYGEGFTRLDRLLAERRGSQPFTFGTTPSYVDITTATALYAARRFGLSVDAHKTLLAIEDALYALPVMRPLRPVVV